MKKIKFTPEQKSLFIFIPYYLQTILENRKRLAKFLSYVDESNQYPNKQLSNTSKFLLSQIKSHLLLTKNPRRQFNVQCCIPCDLCLCHVDAKSNIQHTIQQKIYIYLAYRLLMPTIIQTRECQIINIVQSFQFVLLQTRIFLFTNALFVGKSKLYNKLYEYFYNEQNFIQKTYELHGNLNYASTNYANLIVVQLYIFKHFHQITILKVQQPTISITTLFIPCSNSYKIFSPSNSS
eukprot:TRINITY_DN289_c2_g1_i3.p2 TRINITY_DN289_c2_g1~~TRINITY_DN289_c2_g1_i3.p2  ORF type:complete len:236 (+),score=-26.86 TRINITY_DN289_c2_g1_i3:333-1040(+)